MKKNQNTIFVTEGFEIDGKCVDHVSLSDLEYFCECYPDHEIVVSDCLTESGHHLKALPITVCADEVDLLCPTRHSRLFNCFTASTCFYVSGDSESSMHWRHARKLIDFCKKHSHHHCFKGNPHCGISPVHVKFSPSDLGGAYDSDLDLLLSLGPTPVLLTENVNLFHAKKMSHVTKYCKLNFINKDCVDGAIKKMYWSFVIFSASSFLLFIFLTVNTAKRIYGSRC